MLPPYSPSTETVKLVGPSSEQSPLDHGKIRVEQQPVSLSTSSPYDSTAAAASTSPPLAAAPPTVAPDHTSSNQQSGSRSTSPGHVGESGSSASSSKGDSGSLEMGRNRGSLQVGRQGAGGRTETRGGARPGNSKGWRTLSVSSLQPGDKVLVYRPQSAARHMGHAVNEFIHEQ